MAAASYIVTKGIVLRETETKDADKILTVLTAERGKISVIAKGVRRRSCKYGACAQHLTYSEWTLFQRGEWYYVREAAVEEQFIGLRSDLEALALGCYLAELTEAVTAPESPAPETLRLLLNGLYALSRLHKPPVIVKPAFELRLLGMSLWRTAVPTAAPPIRTAPCWTWSRECCAAEHAEWGSGCGHCHCAGIPWPPCGILYMETPNGFTPLPLARSRWGG